jgi:hypothetical protein
VSSLTSSPGQGEKKDQEKDPIRKEMSVLSENYILSENCIQGLARSAPKVCQKNYLKAKPQLGYFTKSYPSGCFAILSVNFVRALLLTSGLASSIMELGQDTNLGSTIQFHYGLSYF